MTERLGEYELIRELGAGAMGAVFLARHGTLGREVALKQLRVVGERGLARFTSEAQAVARLQHPHIVKLHDAALDGPQPYLVMSYVAGESLDKKLARDGPLAEDEALEITIQLADALAHAHEQGVLHRDLKPANVLLDQEGQAFLTDFGLAKDLAASREALTLTGQIVGTPAFMAPEQATGQRDQIGPWTDVYGLGATLYAMLTGRAPHERTNMMALVAAVAKEAPTPLRELRPGVDRGLAVVVERCLAKSPTRRYVGPRELTDDLERVRDGERPARRLRPGVWAAATLTISILSAGAWLGSRPTLPSKNTSRPGETQAKAMDHRPRSASPSPAPARRRFVRFRNRRWPGDRYFLQGLLWVAPNGPLLAIGEKLGERGSSVWAMGPRPGSLQRVWSGGRHSLFPSPLRSKVLRLSNNALGEIGPDGLGTSVKIARTEPRSFRHSYVVAAGVRDVLLFNWWRQLLVVDSVSGAVAPVSIGHDLRDSRSEYRFELSPDGRFVVARVGETLICVDRVTKERSTIKAEAQSDLALLTGTRALAVLRGRATVTLVSLPKLVVLRTARIPGRGSGPTMEMVADSSRMRVWFAGGLGPRLFEYRVADNRVTAIGRVDTELISTRCKLAVSDRELFYATELGVGALPLKN